MAFFSMSTTHFATFINHDLNSNDAPKVIFPKHTWSFDGLFINNTLHQLT